MEKVWDDVNKKGFGIYDSVLKKRIKAEALAFFYKNGEGTGQLKEEVLLHRGLYQLEKIYNKKFGNDNNPYDIKLLNKNPDLFMERLIRATEICTLRYVLNKDGALNTSEATLKKFRKRLKWS